MPRVSSLVVSPVTPAGDLRSAARDHQRVKQHNTKWSKGFREAPGASCSHMPGRAWKWESPCTSCAGRPCTETRHWQTTHHATPKRTGSRGATVARNALRADVDEALTGTAENSDSSRDDEVWEASAAPSPASEVMYSYDARHGPNHGSQILSSALTQAVTRFENKETEKMVKEYDLVPDGKDEDSLADTEDDFEVIDATQLQ